MDETQIPNYPNYTISRSGIVFDKYKNAPVNQVKRKEYFCVKIENGSNKKYIGVHQLVARTFIPNPENKSFILHVNRNNEDNRVENLKWCNTSEYADFRPKSNNKVSKFKGISKSNNKWSARYKRQWLGQFDSEILAALAYDEHARKAEGNGFAFTNFMENGSENPQLKTVVTINENDQVEEVLIEGEEYRMLPEFPTYRFYKNGYVYSLKKLKFLKGTTANGYKRIKLINSDRYTIYCYVHDLIAKAFIPNTNEKLVIKHKDNCKLNNSVNNLHWVPIENIHNDTKSKSKTKFTSKYNGVTFHKNSQKWESYIVHEQKKIHLGIFNNEENAARAFDETAKILRGKYANLNFKET
jgi:hypothetical protein